MSDYKDLWATSRDAYVTACYRFGFRLWREIGFVAKLPVARVVKAYNSSCLTGRNWLRSNIAMGSIAEGIA